MMVTVLEHFNGSHGQHAALHLCGEIDCDSSPQLAAALGHCLEGTPDDVTVDLAGVSFCDCSGLNVLLAARHRAADEGITLSVTGLRAPVDRLFALAGVKGVLGPARAA